MKMTYFPVSVLASARYLRCLPGFAYLFNQYWSEYTQVIIYLNAPKGTVKPELPRNFSFVDLDLAVYDSWSKAAAAAMKATPDPLAVILLEDYFLDRFADIRQIARLYDYMMTHEGIAKIDLTDDRLKYPYTDWEAINGVPMVNSHPEAPFQTSLQAAIWRKSFFARYLVRDENPWLYEKRGTKRVIADRKTDQQIGLVLGSRVPPLSYINAVGGEGNHPHIWAKKRFPVAIWSHLKALGYVSEE